MAGYARYDIMVSKYGLRDDVRHIYILQRELYCSQHIQWSISYMMFLKICCCEQTSLQKHVLDRCPVSILYILISLR